MLAVEVVVVATQLVDAPLAVSVEEHVVGPARMGVASLIVTVPRLPPDPQTIRETIALAFEQSGLTQTEAARRAGWCQPKLSAYLNGRADANGESLDRLCRVLGLAVQPYTCDHEKSGG